MKISVLIVAILLCGVTTNAQQMSSGRFTRVTYNATILQSGDQTCPSQELSNRTRAEITQDLRALLRNISAAGVQSNTTTVRCGMNGNWRQVTNIDLTNSSQSCPSALSLRTINSQRLCEAATSSGCSSATFSTSGVQFSTVCGRIIGYQDRGVEAFEPYFSNPSLTIDSAYVEGVILTHGTSPRMHIWTFAAAIDETSGYYQEKCPCSSVDLTQTAPIPPWVGNDYFCDSGTRNVNSDWNRFHPEDPLWDGMGCGPSSTCCSLNNPPWFLKRLSSPTSDDIEMRVCVGSNDETPIEMIELYIM